MKIHNMGINDMPRGWRLKNELNERIYRVWHGMIQRCYSEKSLKKRNTYKDCYVCKRWLKLSNFVEDIPKIDGYELWLNNPNQRIALDKDIKSNGNNKCYCLEQCMFATNKENIKQSNKTMDYSFTQTDKYKNKMSKSVKENHRTIVAQIDEDKKIIKIWSYIKLASKELNINYTSITYCCKNKYKSAKTKDGIKTYWKYLTDCTDEEILNYIIKKLQVPIE